MKTLERKFRIGAHRLRARDGSRRNFTLEHRMGRMGGAFNESDLMELLGMADVFFKRAKQIDKKFPNRDFFNDITKSLFETQRRSARNAVTSLRGFFNRFYAPQGIKVIMTFVPVPGEKEPRVYIQGFYDESTLKPVLGDPEDIALALQTKNTHLKPLAEEYALNRKVAKQMLTLPGVTKSAKERLLLVTSGQLSRKLLEG
jgi:hypothetical protein